MTETVKCMVYAFKQTGKWKYDGEGLLHTDIWHGDFLERFLALNDGTIPGMSHYDPTLHYAIIPIEDGAFPIMVPARRTD